MLELSQDWQRLPRGEDLPDTDGKPMDSDIHRTQASKYLIDPLRYWLEQNGIDAFVSGNSFVYYPPTRPGSDKPKRLGPDVYVVLGVPTRVRKKWVVWEEEGRYPDLAIELLSPSTEGKDRGDKLIIYRDQWKVRDYFLFETDDGGLEGFQLVKSGYVTTRGDRAGRHPCRCLPLLLGVHEGWLRWYTQDGELLLTDEERANLAERRADEQQQRADEQQQRADEQQQRAERLAARLKELGLDE